MTSVFIDESGNGGFLDEEQPVFALSATAMDESTAQALKDRYFPAGLLQSQELKHMTLCKMKREKVQKALKDLQQELILHYPCYVYVIEKRFYLIEKMLMDCIPGNSMKVLTIQQMALDIYEEYDQLNQQFDLDGLLKAFAVLNKKDASEAGFSARVENFVEHLMPAIQKSPIFEYALGDFVRGDRGCREELFCSCGCMNIHVALMFGLLDMLLEKVNDEVELVLDESPQYQEVEDGFRNPFFRKVKRVRSASSSSCTGLQMADLLAGGACLAGGRMLCRTGIREKRVAETYIEFLMSTFGKKNNMLFQPPQEPVPMLYRMAEMIARNGLGRNAHV